ncbi:MAG TPA: prolipoprotein diacylglyceryl transferase family protein [Acidobacteriaceae bacterium]|jgi:phosphatidylglycerol:prolipoprotein diacylglycerol transferase|nr:prolipoprotein diacylglyceryl transferase family protein [Acidobacteriaceae bacterium]
MNSFSSALLVCVAVFGRLHLSAYAVIAIVGIIAALALSQYTALRVGLSADKLWDAGIFAIIAAFVLSRLLGFLLLLIIEHGQLTLSIRDVLSFSSISYLSLLVTAVVVILWLRRKHLPLLRVMDAWAPCGALLWAALSLADATSGTGAGLPTRLPWGVHVAGMPAGARAHPVAIYTMVAALVLCGALLGLMNSPFRKPHPPGRIAAIALLAAGIISFPLDMLRPPEQPYAHNLLDVTQWLALASIIAGAVLLLFALRTPSTESR